MSMRRIWIVIGLVAVMVLAFVPPMVGVKPASASSCLGKKVLFDNAHSETAGNADWTITGGYSDFADALMAEGFDVSQWGDNECRSCPDNDPPITYDVLKNYDVYIIPEPNKNFTEREKDAIIKFIKNGGGVFFIGDHWGSDRNRDGWDSVEIFDGWHYGDYKKVDFPLVYDRYFVGRLGFRFRFDGTDEDPLTNISELPITEGVKTIGAWAASSIYNMDIGNVVTVAWYSTGKENAYMVAGRYFAGRFAAIGDSAIFDDGTGAPGDTLYDSWHYGDDAKLAVNTVKWLAGCLPGDMGFYRGRRVVLVIGWDRTTVYNGEDYSFTSMKMDVKPFIDASAGRTLVPVRFVSEALGLRVDWKGDTREVVVTAPTKQITLKIGSKKVKVLDFATGGVKEMEIDVAPRIVPPGRTMVPLRFISETMGYKVRWHARTKTIVISSE